MARKLRTDNGRTVIDRKIECPDRGALYLESDLDDHDCPEDA